MNQIEWSYHGVLFCCLRELRCRIRDLAEARDRFANVPIRIRMLRSSAMKNGLYSVSVKGFDGEDWPPGGVAVLLDGVILGGGPYTYYTGSYSFKDGIFKGELVLNQHNFPPPSHVFFNAKNVGIGVSGTYEDDQAELTGIALVGNRSLTLHVTLLRLAELKPHRARQGLV